MKTRRASTRSHRSTRRRLRGVDCCCGRLRICGWGSCVVDVRLATVDERVGYALVMDIGTVGTTWGGLGQLGGNLGAAWDNLRAVWGDLGRRAKRYARTDTLRLGRYFETEWNFDLKYFA